MREGRCVRSGDRVRSPPTPPAPVLHIVRPQEGPDVTEGNASAVEKFLSERLGCQVETQGRGPESEILFVPEGRRFGELQLDPELASSTAESELLERLRKEGIDELVRRGERVRLSAIATEILPRR